jgi:hypothetical protein
MNECDFIRYAVYFISFEWVCAIGFFVWLAFNWNK